MTNVLIADDSEQILFMLKEVLTHYGYEVTLAINGAEALDKARKSYPDIIISDVLMLIMDGFTFCSECKKDEKLKDIPFVFYTSTFTDSKDEQLALSLRADRFFIKPMPNKEFIRRIKDVLSDAQKKKIRARKSTLEEGNDLLKLYNERLVNKLEKKMLELKKTQEELEQRVDERTVELKRSNEHLKQEVEQRKRAEEALQKTKDDLEIRVKERTAELIIINEQLKQKIREHKQASEALLESEKLYRTLIQSSPDAIILTELDNKIIMCNQQAVTLYGFESMEEIIGKNLLELIAPEDYQNAMDCAQKTLKIGNIRNVEYIFHRKNGTPFPAELSISVILDPEGKPSKFVSVIRDITDRRQGEQRQQLTTKILEILNQWGEKRNVIHNILLLIKKSTGIESVGVHLKEGEGLPYYDTKGFSRWFINAERSLCKTYEPRKTVWDSKRNFSFDCLCGKVINEKTDQSLPCFTENGSFWTSAISEFNTALLENDLYAYTLNRCKSEGFESLALIPLHSGKEVIGLLQLSDHRRGIFNEEWIRFFEKIGASVGIALNRKRAEDALRESEELYSNIVESISEGLVVLDTNFQYLVWNKGMEKLTKFSRKEIMNSGKRPWEVFSYLTEVGIIDMMKESMQGKVVKRQEIPYRLQDGTRGFTSEIYMPLKKPDGTIRGILGVIHDITESRIAEKALRESEGRFRKLFEQSNDAIFIYDFNGNLLDVNKRSCDMLGYMKKELLSKHLQDLFPKQALSDSRKALKSIKDKDSFFLESKFKKADGTIIDIEISASIIDKEKQVIQGIVRDITERKKAEEALRESEERFRQIAENIQEVFFLLEKVTEKFLFISPVCEVIFGLPRQKVYEDPSSILDIIDPEDRANVLFANKKRRYTSPISEEFRIMRPDGELRWVRLQSFLIYNNSGEVCRIAGVFTDLTIYKKAEESARVHQQQLIQADKMASLGILVSGVAHEINNPNNLIMLNSDVISRLWKEIQILLDKYYEDDKDFYLGGLPYNEMRRELDGLITGISQGAVRINRIVNSLKDFVRLDKGDLNQTININSVVESGVFIVNNLIKKSTNRFLIEYGKGLPNVKGNAQQLEQVIINLITNSCQALPNIKCALYVLTKLADDCNNVEIIVKDEGIGISSENMQRIMDPFFTTKRATGGTGLGLSVSYRIIQTHGGTLMFESEVGKGTIAKISLPTLSSEA